MKSKQFYILVIAIIFIATMIIYHDQMTFAEITLAFISSGSTIGWIYQWLITDNEREEKLLWRKSYHNALNENIKMLEEWNNQGKSQEKTSQDT